MAGKLAVFGSGCNPIGLHHKRIAKAIWDELRIKTWIMPCAKHRFEKNSELIETKYRWDMACAACSGINHMVPLDYEYRKEHNGSTIETMEALSQMADMQLFVVIGMDNANIIESKWHRGQELIERFPFIVVKRKGVEQAADWFEKEPHQIIEVDSDGSSSQIRQAIKDGDHKLACRMLDPAVWDYIKKEKLYGYKE